MGEIRILGGATLCAPLLLSCTMVTGALVLLRLPGTHTVSLFLSWFIVQGLLPLLVGFLAASHSAHEAAGELAFTWPVAYERVAFGRFALILGSGMLAISVSLIIAVSWGSWPLSAPFVGPLSMMRFAEWGGCLLAMWGCAALGWGGSVVLRSAAASRVVLTFVGLVGLLASAESGGLREWVLLQLGWLIIGSLALGCGWWRIRQVAWSLAQREEDA